MTQREVMEEKRPESSRYRLWGVWRIIHKHDCFVWAYEQINTEARRKWAAERFSGVLRVDEARDGDRTILYAADPLGDFTVDFEIVEKNDQASMDAFLAKLTLLGIHPKVVITDGSPLYKDALQLVGEGVEHPLRVFHVIKEVNRLILNGVRTIKNRLRRQGRKGRERGRGRPTEAARKRFEKMIVFLKYGKDAERTNNHVERNNRAFRMLQKTRYKRRREHTIRMAIELDLYARMLCHVLFRAHPDISLPMLQQSKTVAA